MFDKDELAEMMAEANAEQMAGDPILRKVFSVSLLASDLFVAVEESEEEQKQAGGVSLQAIAINNAPHVLLFSSKEKLEAFTGPSTRFARVNGLDIVRQLRGEFAILNPGPDGRAFAPEDIAEILGDDANPPHGQKGHVHGQGCGHDH